MIQFHDVNFSYSDNSIFKDANLELNKKISVLIGPSGSGKSTFALLLNAINRAQSGSINIFDYQIDEKFKLKQNKEIRRDVSYVWQLADSQIFNATVFDEIVYNIKNFNLNVEEYRIEILRYLTIFNLPTEILSYSPFKLSGGQKKKISIIGAILQKPKLLILDEPTVSLDPQSKKDIFKIIDELDLNVLIITHDNEIFNEFNSEIEVIKVDDKKFEKFNTQKEYLQKHFNKEMFDLLPLKYHYGKILGVDFEQIYQTSSDKEFVTKFGDICRIK